MKNIFLFSLLLSTHVLAQDCPDCSGQSSSVTGAPIAEVPEWPVEFVKVEKVDYPRNEAASFCRRPLEMVDTVVFHHSESGTTTSALNINRMHMNRGTRADPWYMIAYSYVINSPYAGARTPTPRVTEGRPMDIVGAHAGTGAYVPMNEDQRRMWNEGRVVCGRNGGQFTVDPGQVRDGMIKANVTTVGVVVVGNYSPFSRLNPDGYSRRSPRHPTPETIRLAARMACQLQKKWPNIKNIKWHNFYNDTSCPGNIKQKIPDIIRAAKELGCDFN